jgi:putative endonuclease
MYEHKHGLIEGFTRKYGVKRLVYYEQFDDPLTAIEREKQIKRWSRSKKLALVRLGNPSLEELWAKESG